MLVTEFSNLNRVMLNNNTDLKIFYNGIDYYLKIFLKNNQNNLVVFSNGAVDRKRKQPPIFQRSSWKDNIEASCIFLDDRTLHNNNLNTGWGFGSSDRHYIRDYSAIIRKITNLLAIDNNNVYYYGSSAGGFMSLILATFHRESTAIVNNPQTDLNKHFNPTSVNNLFKEVLPKRNRKEIVENFKERIYVVENFIIENYVPNILYIQNAMYSHDMKIHYQPFFEALAENGLNHENVKSLLYYNEKLGHTPLNKEKTELIINSAINKKYDF